MRLDLLKPIGLALRMLLFTYTSFAGNPNIQVSHFPSGEPIYYSISACQVCDNITNGGQIAADEIGCPNPHYDPHLIYNVLLPSGGTGIIEYQWMYTYENPNYPSAVWSPIPNANGPEYDPGPIVQTTYYMRCSRRSGCVAYAGETNFVKKEVLCCLDNLTDGGLIAAEQKSCTIPFDPEMLYNVKTPAGSTNQIFYQWLSSPIGGAINNGTWNIIPGATANQYDPPSLSKTMYFVRRAKEEFCPEYQYSNILKILVSNGVLLTTSKTDPTCFESGNGSVTVTPTQGASPFMYKWSNSVVMTPTLINLGGGMYKVTVTDAAGCVAVASITLNEPGEIDIMSVIEPIGCVGQTTGKITLTVSGGMPGYTYKWSSGESVQNLANKSGGTYTVTVTDSKQCSKTKNFTIIEGATFNVTPIIVNNICADDQVGSIKLLVTGGVLPYTFLWSNGGNTNEITKLTTGTYTVTITDKNSCSRIDSYSISETASLTINSKAFSPKCYNAFDGSILVAVTGGKSPYKYKWSTGGTTQIQSGLKAGTYVLTVTDANLCTKTQSFTLINPADISITGDIEKPDCIPGNNGSIDVTIVGGILPYTILWNGAPSIEDLTNLSEGSYTLFVSDSIGCTKEQVFTLTIENDISISEVITEPSCQTNNGSITLNVTGGVGPYFFIWSDSTTSNNLINLAAGNYAVTITDSLSCSKTKSYNLSDIAGVDIIGTVSLLKCHGDSNGIISINITGGIIPYSIEWSNGIQDTQILDSLKAGNYTVTVTDNNQCVSIETFELVEPKELDINPLITEPQCYNLSNGSIQLNIMGGTAPYIHKWNNADTTNFLQKLKAGIYKVTVSDINTCSSIESIQVLEPDSLIINSIIKNPSCVGDTNGTIEIDIIGGTSPFTYEWNGIISTPDQSDLSPGIYSLIVTDANGCTAYKNLEIKAPELIQIQALITDPYCNFNNGKIDLIAIGGTGNYSYLWSNASITNNLKDLAPGTYVITVTDANLCQTIASYTLIDAGGLSLNSITEDVACNMDSSGTIEIAISGGVIPYTYTWNTGSPDQNKIDSLVAGIYTVTVTDANQCSIAKSFQINEAAELIVGGIVSNVKCNGDEDGSINITVSGGEPGYSFIWSNGIYTQNNAGLSAGTYDLTVTDNSGCFKTLSFIVEEPEAINVANLITKPTCFDGFNGKIDLSISGGTPGYSFAWNNGKNTEDLDSLSSNIYSVTVTDANLCNAVRTYIITEPVSINLQAIIENTTCNGGSNGTIALIVLGGTPPFNYIWSNSSSNKNQNNLTAGNYTVTVTDLNGCSQIKTFSVSEENNLLIQESIIPVGCFGEKNASISLNVSGGILPYLFNWSNGGQTNTIALLGAGTYGVTISDQTGCKQVKSLTITQPTDITINISKLDVSCPGNNDGKIIVNAMGGQMPFIFNWSNTSQSDTLTGLSPGNYTVTVTDANGCSKISSTNINNPLDITISAVVNSPSCSNTLDGSIDLSVTDGNPPYSYLWNNNATTQDLSSLAPGSYSVTVQDKNACIKTAIFTIVLPNPISFDFNIVDQTCINQNNGSATIINITGGSSPYTFKWNNPAKSITQNVNNLAPGFYQVTVTDSKGCSTIKGLEIKSTTNHCELKIGDYVWLDANKNGLQDSTENGINGIVVHLINVGADSIPGTGDDILTDTKSTKTSNGKSGYYCFLGTPKGTYVIKFFIDNNVNKFTLKDVGANDAKDSDVNPSTGYTDKFTVKAGDADKLTIDAGLYQYCNNITSGGSICCDEVLCTIGQVPQLIKNISLPSGGSGPIEYLWLYSTKNPIYSPGSPDWIMIPNSNTPSYQPGPLFETTHFIRCAKKGDCSNFAGETNVVTKRVVDGKTAEIFGAPLTICQNKYVNLSSINYGPGVSYLWDLGPGAIPATATTNNVSVIWGFPGVKTIKLTVSFDSCKSSDVAVIVVSNCISNVNTKDFESINNEELHLFDNNSSAGSTEKIKEELKPYYKGSIAVFPNPAISIITIDPLNTTKKNALLEITDVIGNVMFQTDLEPGFTSFNIDINKYAPGSYFVKLKEDGEPVIIYKIIKID